MSKKHRKHNQQKIQNQDTSPTLLPTPSPSKPESKSTTGVCEHVKDNNLKWPNWAAKAAVATAAANIVTLLAFIAVSSCQLSLTRESNEHAYRAWLTVKQVRDAPPIVAGSHAPLTAEIENTGRSPASNVQVSATTAYAPLNWIVPNRVTAAIEGSGVIGPGQTRSVIFALKDVLSQAEVDAINNGKQRIYWFADVTYTDQFGSDRLLQFCFFYVPSMKDKSVVSYPVCPTHESVK